MWNDEVPSVRHSNRKRLERLRPECRAKLFDRHANCSWRFRLLLCSNYTNLAAHLRLSQNHARRAMPNHLATESSPYLLQHQNNPVDWYPWGSEAIDRSKK